MSVPKTKTIKIDTTEFSKFTSSDYIILKKDDIETNDYILFVETVTSNDIPVETGQFRMASVKGVTESDGLKDGYALFFVNKL